MHLLVPVHLTAVLRRLFHTLEGAGVSACTDAAQSISSNSYLTAAASVLSTEARYASWVATAVGNVAR